MKGVRMNRVDSEIQKQLADPENLALIKDILTKIG